MTQDDLTILAASIAGKIHRDVLAAGIRGGWKAKHLSQKARAQLAEIAASDAMAIVKSCHNAAFAETHPPTSK